jgi:hypothetical protein
VRPIIGWRKGDYEFIINPMPFSCEEYPVEQPAKFDLVLT